MPLAIYEVTSFYGAASTGAPFEVRFHVRAVNESDARRLSRALMRKHYASMAGDTCYLDSTTWVVPGAQLEGRLFPPTGQAKRRWRVSARSEHGLVQSNSRSI